MSSESKRPPAPANQATSVPSHRQPLRGISAIRPLLKEPLVWLLVAAPAAATLHAAGSSELAVFVLSAVAIIPLAGLMGRATESVAVTMGEATGGLLNATFGNAAELIIALIALSKGADKYPLVKASLTGSIIGNALLVLGAAILAGGFRFKRQKFNRTAAALGATMLALAATALIVPTLYYHLHLFQITVADGLPRTVELLSEEIALVLIVVYLLSLWFSLRTHSHLFASEPDSSGEWEVARHEPEWERGTALAILIAATVGVGWMAEMMVATVEHACQSLGMSSVFVGVVVVAVVGNAAEHSTAVLMAMKNKMDLAVNIAVGSSIQIALFVAPVLVFASMLMGHPQTLDLHFTPLEVVALVASVAVLALVCQDGESHWMEGVMLLAVYVVLALAFYHLPDPTPIDHPAPTLATG